MAAPNRPKRARAVKQHKSRKWRSFEREVMQLYRDLGALDVEHDIDIDGNQIDVFARVPAMDGTSMRTIISCKCYSSPVGVQAVKEWNLVFRSLHQANKVDTAIIVSHGEFSRPAKALAASIGIRVLTLDQLRWASADLSPYLLRFSAALREEMIFKHDRFVPMRVKHDVTYTIEKAVDAVEAFIHKPHPHLLTLLGDYGAGKTTLCKWLFQRLASRFLEDPSSNRVPIYLLLRDYPGQLSIKSFVLDVLLNQYDCRVRNYAAIDRLVAEGRVVIFLDAFDEMATRADYRTTLNNFRALQQLLHGKSKVVLTCRTHYFKNQGELHDVHKGTELYRVSQAQHYAIAFLQPFQPEDIETYVRNVGGNDGERYLQEIRDTYDLSGLAQRPILLEMITDVLPTLAKQNRTINSTQLYAMYVKMWLQRDDWRVTLSKDERLNFTIMFANTSYHGNKQVFSWEEIAGAIRSKWPTTTAQQLEHYEHDIRTCTFIKRAGDNYEFVHNSFMEYFVASRLYSDIIGNHSESFLERTYTPEVLLFLTEHVATEEARGTIRRWLAESPSKHLTANLFGVLASWDQRLQGTFANVELIRQRFVGVNCDELMWKQCKFEAVVWMKGIWREWSSTNGNWKECELKAGQLEKAAFHDETWVDCEVSNSVVKGCSWTSCTLERLHFHETTLQEVQFERCGFLGLTIKNGKTNGVWRGCELDKCKLDGAHLLSCKFFLGQIANTDFASAVLTGTLFSELTLSSTRWSVTSLDGVKFDRVNFGNCDDIADLGLARKGIAKWIRAPEFFKPRGLTKKAMKQLQDLGATVVGTAIADKKQ
jgi:uncharacterized protein YjbI with pentapeptide repeats